MGVEDKLEPFRSQMDILIELVRANWDGIIIQIDEPNHHHIQHVLIGFTERQFAFLHLTAGGLLGATISQFSVAKDDYYAFKEGYKRNGLGINTLGKYITTPLLRIYDTHFELYGSVTSYNFAEFKKVVDANFI